MRKPTEKEYEKLTDYVVGLKYGKEHTTSQAEFFEELGYLKSCYIAIFDDYVTDCPGYAEKIAMVVYGGSPDYYQLFIEKNGKFEYLPQSQDFIDLPRKI